MPISSKNCARVRSKQSMVSVYLTSRRGFVAEVIAPSTFILLLLLHKRIGLGLHHHFWFLAAGQDFHRLFLVGKKLVCMLADWCISNSNPLLFLLLFHVLQEIRINGNSICFEKRPSTESVVIMCCKTFIQCPSLLIPFLQIIYVFLILMAYCR